MGSRQGRRWLAWAAGASLVSGAISGCSDGGAELTATPTTTSTSAVPTTSAATPSPLVTAVPLPVMPPEMANNDAAGAEAAVRYFVDLADFALATGKLDEWRRSTDDNCAFCQSISQSAIEVETNKWVRRGGGLEVVDIARVAPTSVSGFFLVEAEISERGYDYLDQQGAVVETVSGSTGRVTFGVQHADGTWKLIAAGSAEEDSA